MNTNKMPENGGKRGSIMKQQSPLLRIWELGEKEHGRLIGAIVLAAVGVIGGMVPYFAAAKMVALLMSGERDLSVYLIWGGVAMAGYAGRTALRDEHHGQL